MFKCLYLRIQKKKINIKKLKLHKMSSFGDITEETKGCLEGRKYC